MMASDDKKTKPQPAPKKESIPKDKGASGADASKAADSPKTTDSPKTADASKTTDAPKAEAGETTGAAPKGYSRGEGQKPVTQAYKDNWNAIFAKKKKKR
jgi:hypothetical protein